MPPRVSTRAGPVDTDARAALLERRRLAADLHDGPLQLLAGALASLRASEREFDQQSPTPSAREALADGIRLVQAAANEMRNVVYPLAVNPSAPPDLEATARRVMRRFTPAAPTAVHLSPLPDLSWAPTAEEAVLGIIGEALANAGKHAHASNVWVEVTTDATAVTCLIRDDGVGFDLDAAERAARLRKSLGLHLIQERARLAGGSVTISSHPQRGTVVQARIPLPPPPPAAAGLAEDGRPDLCGTAVH
jgi:signal transduction histidine kinase